MIYFIVCEPENTITVLMQKSSSFFVMFRFGYFVMLATVKFNDEFILGAVKIRYIVAQYFLTLKFCGMGSQKVIPKMSFLFGHVFPKISGIGNKVRVV